MTEDNTGNSDYGLDSGTPSSSKSKKTSTTDRKLDQRLWENGVRFKHPNAKPPKDLATVERYLDQDRESQLSDEDDYQKYLTEISVAENEETAKENFLALLAKETPAHIGYHRSFNFQWTGAKSAITANISDPKPDIFESFRREQYPPRAIEALGPALAPTSYGAAMPKFCVELKGLDAQMLSATKQAAYDGAVMVDTAWAAHRYMSKPADDLLGSTQAITVAASGTYIHMYVNHAITPQAKVANYVAASKAVGYPERLQYHQFTFRSIVSSQSLKSFQEARRTVRNAQDWAREKAVETKDALHAHVDGMHGNI